MVGVAKVDNVRRVVRPFALFAVALLATNAGAPVGAATPPRRDSKLDTLRSQVAEASAEEAALLGRIDSSAARRRALDGRVASIDQQIAGVQADLDAAQQRLDALQAQVTVIEGRLAEARGELAVAKDDLRRRALAAYMGRSDAGEDEKAMDTQNRGMELALFLTLPAMVALIVAAEPIVRGLFQYGHFDAADTVKCSWALAGFSSAFPLTSS